MSTCSQLVEEIQWVKCVGNRWMEEGGGGKLYRELNRKGNTNGRIRRERGNSGGKLKNLLFISLGCRLPRQNTSYCSCSLCLASAWQ